MHTPNGSEGFGFRSRHRFGEHQLDRPTPVLNALHLDDQELEAGDEIVILAGLAGCRCHTEKT